MDIGAKLGRYRIVERLGEGGMGTVFRAHDDFIDRAVAIKVLRPELANNPALLERFRAEAIALARLSHPRIAILHGLEQDGQQLFMVMEFLAGETVEKLVRRLNVVPWPRAVEIAAAVLEALDHAHDMGVVHRDIKPANVMISPSGNVKVMDFGIARITGRDRQTKIGNAVGTPVYMSPEQLRGEECDGRADLYAVGGMLFEMITGRVAFDADSDYKLMMMQLNDPPPSASTLVPGVPKSIDAIVDRSMAKARASRYVSAAAMRSALLATVGQNAPVIVSSAPAPAPNVTRLAITPEEAFAAPRASTPAPASSSGGVAETVFASASNTQTPGVKAATPIYRDWRSWVAVAAVVAVIAALTYSPSKKPSAANTVASAPNKPQAPTNAPNVPTSTSTGGTPVDASVGAPKQPRYISGAPVLAPGGNSSDSANASRAGTGAGATSPSKTTGGSTGSPSGAPTRKPPASPPSSSAPEKKPVTSPPVTTDPVVRPDSPKIVTPPPVSTSESASATNEDAVSAIDGFLALIRSGDAGALGSVAQGAPANFLTVVRERRASASAPNDVSVSGHGSTANVSFSTNLTWKNPFGANRKGVMRVNGTMVRDGRSWRISRATIAELPDVK